MLLPSPLLALCHSVSQSQITKDNVSVQMHRLLHCCFCTPKTLNVCFFKEKKQDKNYNKKNAKNALKNFLSSFFSSIGANPPECPLTRPRRFPELEITAPLATGQNVNTAAKITAKRAEPETLPVGSVHETPAAAGPPYLLCNSQDKPFYV